MNSTLSSASRALRALIGGAATAAAIILCGAATAAPATQQPPSSPPSFSGIYPHLAVWNNEAECGTGAVVPWADRLWVITYGPHLPGQSSDKLYEIDDALSMTVRRESVGGTCANRMIHAESRQLFIGPYAIDDQRNVRVIARNAMPGRLTGNARHLTDPARRIYFATMEEGFYEVDVKSLGVTQLYQDANVLKDHSGPLLPGYHGKGLYSGQGRLVYANNGENSAEARRRRPDVDSGCLAEWDGTSWTVVRRTQFTEVTGPGGITGNATPQTDPIWSIGWDHRSLILMLRDGGQWHTYRLPKASHCYDGAHGWNTEWPRIRDIGEESLLMTMHGAFWRFPASFSPGNAAGISQRCTYLKVIGDFCRWKDDIVLGCDDSARNEFLNKRAAKGTLAGPSISHSNLWFVAPSTLDGIGGPARGNGAVWLDEPVAAGTPSDAYLFSGFDRRAALIAHEAESKVAFRFEVDLRGDGSWRHLRTVTVPAAGSTWIEFPKSDEGVWVRVRTDKECPRATVQFSANDKDVRPTKPDACFDGLALPEDRDYSTGLLHAGGTREPVLCVAASKIRGGKQTDEACYEMDSGMTLRRVDTPGRLSELKQAVPVPAGVLQSDDASLLYLDEAGRRFRLPKGDPAFDRMTSVPLRVCREVCTERDLFHAQGIFYELPAENAGGFALMRAVAAHRYMIGDYCSWRGLLVLSGISAEAPANSHIVRSADGNCTVWLGAVDDLWKIGKPRGHGCVWRNYPVVPGHASDPYLCNGFDRKRLTIRHDAAKPVTFRVEADFTGRLAWHTFKELRVPAGKPFTHEFPSAFSAYWLRLVPNTDCRATAEFHYD